MPRSIEREKKKKCVLGTYDVSVTLWDTGTPTQRFPVLSAVALTIRQTLSQTVTTRCTETPTPDSYVWSVLKGGLTQRVRFKLLVKLEFAFQRLGGVGEIIALQSERKGHLGR